MSLQILLEKECEKNALLETLLQTREELRETCQQLEQLRQEAEEQQENKQVSLTSRVDWRNSHWQLDISWEPGNRVKGTNKDIKRKSWDWAW